MVDLAKFHFGDKLIACYVLGSIAHGGFSPLISDIDIALILADPIKNDYSEKVNLINHHVKESKIKFCNKLSIYFATIESLNSQNKNVRFPAYDKLDLRVRGHIWTLCYVEIGYFLVLYEKYFSYFFIKNEFYSQKFKFKNQSILIF